MRKGVKTTSNVLKTTTTTNVKNKLARYKYC